ncbi:hypothetical protein [Streptomyces sp. NPDC003077]|uniref:hypothetical protein n=1 Tax=Streptomyces sp. NPDC003077 TaxID=3154443 RepID=UPI0033BA23CA
MNRTSASHLRRVGIAAAASGFPERVPVALYACIHDGQKPEEVMAALRTYAEARDWVVRAALYDTTSITSTCADRQAWPEVQRLLEAREVEGLVVPHEDEVAFYQDSKQELRHWLLTLPAWATYLDVSDRPLLGGATSASGSTAPVRLKEVRDTVVLADGLPCALDRREDIRQATGKLIGHLHQFVMWSFGANDGSANELRKQAHRLLDLSRRPKDGAITVSCWTYMRDLSVLVKRAAAVYADHQPERTRR